jgi:glycosyltransferase involved in cell wall biosynthesis
MKVVHVSTIHSPLDVRIFYKECRTLAAAGYDVHLAVCDPPSRRRDGVAFHPIAQVPRTKWFPRIFGRLQHAFKAARSLTADVYHIHDAELVAVGILLKLTGARVIYDVHEDSPREAFLFNEGRPWRGRLYFITWTVLDGLSKWLLDGMIAATPAIAKRFPARKTAVVQNFPILGELEVAESVPYAERRPLIAYVGAIFASRGIREMVQAVALLPETLDAQLILAGKFTPPELEEEVRHLPGWERTEFVGWLSRDGVARLLGRARVGVVLLHLIPYFSEAQPIKLFEYMAAGIPIVASDFPLWREFVEGAGCGILVDPGDPQAIAGAIRWLLEHPAEAEAMGQRGREAARTRYNWDQEAQKLLAFYGEVLRQRS